MRRVGNTDLGQIQGMIFLGSIILFVVPAKAGTQSNRLKLLVSCSSQRQAWVPAFAGMTD
jgi:hypothetical protein